MGEHIGYALIIVIGLIYLSFHSMSRLWTDLQDMSIPCRCQPTVMREANGLNATFLCKDGELITILGQLQALSRACRCPPTAIRVSSWAGVVHSYAFHLYHSFDHW